MSAATTILFIKTLLQLILLVKNQSAWFITRLQYPQTY